MVVSSGDLQSSFYIRYLTGFRGMMLGLVYCWRRDVVSRCLWFMNFAQNGGQRQVKGNIVVQVLFIGAI